MGGTARTNLNVFKRMVGDESLKNVIVATTMWDGVSQQLGQARENELRSDPRYHKTMLDNGARLVRHDNTAESARQILQFIIDNQPLPLHIQNEMVVEGKELPQTDAAAELNRVIELKEQNIRAELTNIQQGLSHALQINHEEMTTLFQQFKAETEDRIRQIEKAKEERRTAFSPLASFRERLRKTTQEFQEVVAETNRLREERRARERRVDGSPMVQSARGEGSARRSKGNKGSARAVGLSVLIAAGSIFVVLQRFGVL